MSEGEKKLMISHDTNSKKITDAAEYNSPAEQRELSPEEFSTYSNIAIETISGDKNAEKILEDETALKETIERTILAGVNNLPEKIAENIKTVDPTPFNEQADNIVSALKIETDPSKRAELQKELIFQFITIISRVQNGGDKGIIPSVAREVNGLDCSLSTWSLKEKLASSGVQDITFEFGYPNDHAVGIITVADGKRLYVDAQNGYVAEITLQEVVDEQNMDTAYPIFEITSHQLLTGTIGNEGKTQLTREDGCDYIPKFLGIQESGTLHTIGNFHMLINRESPLYATEAGASFRKALDNDPKKWKRFELFAEKIAGGKVIQETKFKQLSEEHKKEYDIRKLKSALSNE